MSAVLRVYGGASPGSENDLLARIVLSYLRDAFPDLRTRQMPAGASEGILKVEMGEADLTVSSLSPVSLAWNGRLDIHKKPMTNLRHVFSFPSLPGSASMLLVVLKNSPIKQIPDLFNKKLAMGPITSVAFQVVESALKTYGITKGTLEKNGGMMIYPSWVENVELLASGKVDVSIAIGTHPNPQLVALNNTRGIRFLLWSDEALDAMAKEQFFLPNKNFDIARFYPGTEPGKVHPVKTMWGVYAHKNVPDDTIFNVLAAVFKDNVKRAGEIVDAWKGLDYLASPTMTTIPPHPGAVKYWKMRGVDHPSKEAIALASKYGMTLSAQ